MYPIFEDQKTGGSHKSKIVCTWFKNIPKLKGVHLAGVLVWMNKEIQRLGASYLTILWIFVRMHNFSLGNQNLIVLQVYIPGQIITPPKTAYVVKWPFSRGCSNAFSL